ncbi:hypothetical protein E9549_13710 [Blastococcus sp. MG754426]|uniref:hypothetical protein n=1 Tax=unclassified Blastococcus TaxID=2619396 RepID=UPI001EF0407F|nr:MULTISPECIES: hypothetical protein [unclassified Blastococcus]MCF6508455.1 hypothetical protein [Blastococcus sp. MG754426]MCF6513456.1 hypothetical protein [Blastococcus sp. MG754427]
MTKSDGIFFLEPSFASQYFALAAVMTLRRWPPLLPLFVVALVSTGGGTGIVVLLAGCIYELLRGTLTTRAMSTAALAVGSFALFYLGLNELVLSRVGEIGSAETSGAIRFVAPYESLDLLIEDAPLTALVGAGPGSAEFVALTQGILSNFPLPAKAAIEYGILVAIAMTTVVTAISWRLRLEGSARVGILAIMLLLSGALLQVHTACLLWAFYVQASHDNTTPVPIGMRSVTHP